MRSKHLLLTTTSTLDGWQVDDYLGPVSAQFVIGTGLFADFFSGWTDLFGAHSKSYQRKLDRIHDEALQMISDKALRLGASAVLGLRVDHDEIAGNGKSMLMVTATGTAVKATRVARPQNTTAGAGHVHIIDSEDLTVLLKKAHIVARVQKGGFEWVETANWEFIVEHQVSDVATAFLDYCDEESSYTTPEAVANLRRRFDEYLSSLPRDTAIDLLYGCVSRSHTVFTWALAALKQLNGFNPQRVAALCRASAPDLAAQRAAQFSLAHLPSYAPDDITALIMLRDAIESSFPVAPTYTGTGLFGRKTVRRCACGNEVAADNDRCGCGRDRYGFHAELTPPPALILILQRRIDALTGHFATLLTNEAVVAV